MEHLLSGQIGVPVTKAVSVLGIELVAVPQPCMEELSARETLLKKIHSAGAESVAQTPLIILDAFKRAQETIHHIKPCMDLSHAGA